MSRKTEQKRDIIIKSIFRRKRIMIRHQEERDRIKGMAVSNPVDVEKEYLLYTVDFAAENGFNHLQIVGPIHNPIKGNIDGMTLYRKYSQFNDEKDLGYIEQAKTAINEACQRTVKNGIKTYVWHHELELPLNFKECYPEVQNSCGDIEVTHPLVRDFLENKIIDFFYEYPDINGIILTLHETKIPLLKLKEQKLGKIERVKYVTEVLYHTCNKLNKELIVRPFSSVEEDYIMMTQAYEEISTDMLIMDKWTQFDWSLTLPNNAFYNKIGKNPLFVEGDVFGEYFGKGHLPLMLKEHIAEKIEYCEGFAPRGYVARVDRNGEIPFNNVNEINVAIFAAYMNGQDVEQVIDRFFERQYAGAAKEVKELMEETESIVRKIIYAKGYYFSEMSYFPNLNHCKNHFYFEMMKEKCDIASNEWFIPKNWNRGKVEGLISEKKTAVYEATRLYGKLCELKDKLKAERYEELWTKFMNLQQIAGVWLMLAMIFADYVKYFETRNSKYEESFKKNCEILLEKYRYGVEILGEKFYCLYPMERATLDTRVERFVKEIQASFSYEKETSEAIEQEDVVDYIVCGGGMEGHRLQKEVNFSDTLMKDNMLCRIPGSLRGMGWCSVNAHGWFSYEVAVAPNTINNIKILMGSSGEQLDVSVDIGGKSYTIQEELAGTKEYCFNYEETTGRDTVRIRFDKISGYTPCVFWIKTVVSSE